MYRIILERQNDVPTKEAPNINTGSVGYKFEAVWSTYPTIDSNNVYLFPILFISIGGIVKQEIINIT